MLLLAGRSPTFESGRRTLVAMPRRLRKKLTALIERACTDAMEAERLWKEQDDLL